MEKEYTGIIVEESFDDNRILNQYDITKVRISGHASPKDRWHLYQVNVSKEEIYSLAEHMIDIWYNHFWKGTHVIAVFTGNHIFEFDYNNKDTWKAALDYGRSVSVPEEQLDFPIQGY